MIEYFERNYGADADGNRGISFWTFELEPSDEPYIKEQVMELLEGYDEEDYPKTVTVSLFSNATDEYVDFEVDVKDYMPL